MSTSNTERDNCKRMGMVQVLFTISLLADIPQLGATTILVTAPELQEDLIGTKVISVSFISITCLSTGATRDPGHSTRVARGWVRYKGEKGTSSVHLYLSKIRRLVPREMPWHQRLQEVSLYQFI